MPTIRTNISTFFDTSATITNVTPTDQWVITPGQPAKPPTANKTSQPGDNYTAFSIEFDAGRESSSDVATDFINLCGGADHMFGIGAMDGTPGSLNFYFGVTLQLKGSLDPVTVYLAQGSEVENNWWIGGGISSLANSNLFRTAIWPHSIYRTTARTGSFSMPVDSKRRESWWAVDGFRWSTDDHLAKPEPSTRP